VANIALKKVIPAMQRGQNCEVLGIASRDRTRAETAAREASIPKAYGSYEELLADPEIEAIYNPLPNHLHVPWSIRAAEAGKHVLCEKPVAMSAAETLELIAARDRTGVVIGEAFMVQTHPQWTRLVELVRGGRIGELRSGVSSFCYYNRNRDNIRNVRAYGGGALMDIGCYPIVTSRFVFGSEPRRVSGLIDRDPDLHIDRLTSALLEFPTGHALFTCSTQLSNYQRMLMLGTKGRIEVEIPFNAPPDQVTRILVDGAAVEFPVCDQYGLQGDAFSRAILDNTEVPTPLEESLANMAVIDAVFQSAATGHWTGGAGF